MTNGRRRSGATAFNEKQGYSVDFIRRLESVLLGYDVNSPESFSKESEEGRFTEQLTEAVKEFQGENGLVADGMLGKITLKSLRERYPDILDERLTGEYLDQEGRTIVKGDSDEKERYEFYRNIVLGRFGVWRGDNEMINVIGIRGMKDNKQIKNVFDKHNDTISIAYRDGEGRYFVKEFLGSVDPGDYGTRIGHRSPRGLAHIKDGSYVYYLGTHPCSDIVRGEIVKTAKSNSEKSQYVINHPNNRYDALQPKIKVTLYRDKDFDGKITEDEMEEEDRGKFGINIHYSSHTKPYSSGCQVISGMGQYFEFINTVKGSKNKRDVPYTTVHASKIASM